MRKNAIVVLLLIIPCMVGAQELQGLVYQLGTDRVLAEVDIKNLRTGEVVRSNTMGFFRIPVEKEQRLEFSLPGYRTDTLVVTEHGLKRIYLTPINSPTLLSEVKIIELTNAELSAAIQDATEKGKIAGTGSGLWISPSRIFGKEARDARKLREYLIAEQRSRKIFSRFTPELIESLTPLRGRELDLFMVKYKPGYSFVQQTDDATLRLYILDSYREFKTLTPEELDNLKLLN